MLSDSERILLRRCDHRSDPNAYSGVPDGEAPLPAETIILFPFDLPFFESPSYREAIVIEFRALPFSDKSKDTLHKHRQHIARYCRIMTLDEFTTWFQEVDTNIQNTIETDPD